MVCLHGVGTDQRFVEGWSEGSARSYSGFCCTRFVRKASEIVAQRHDAWAVPVCDTYIGKEQR